MNQHLDLHFAQLSKVWAKSKHNIYSDQFKTEYQKKLSEVFYILKNEDFSTLTELQLQVRTIILNFIFKSLEFLDNSTLNSMPFEMINCLTNALNDWETEGQYIIVTSHVNGINAFSFDSTLVTNPAYHDSVFTTYGKEFTPKLIQINVPVHLKRDYLSNVNLYHELGHFIDTKNSINLIIYTNIIKSYYFNQPSTLTQDEKNDLLKYFPYLETEKQTILTCCHKNRTYKRLQYHIMEYFADLFAAQYIGSTSVNYLEYITQSQKQYSETHPLTAYRKSFVNEFLTGEDSPTLKIFKRNIEVAMPGKAIIKRFEEVEASPFLNFIPIDIQNEKQLHYLFILGWNLWAEKREEFKTSNNIEFDLENLKIYEIINNLIEKSIGNYIIVKSWNNAKTHVSK